VCGCSRVTPQPPYTPPGHAHPPRVSRTAGELLLLTWDAQFSRRLTCLEDHKIHRPLFTRKDFRNSLDKGDLKTFADYDCCWTCDLRTTYLHMATSMTTLSPTWHSRCSPTHCVRPAHLLASDRPNWMPRRRRRSSLRCQVFPLTRG
jgi:hypothetical protein